MPGRGCRGPSGRLIGPSLAESSRRSCATGRGAQRQADATTARSLRSFDDLDLRRQALDLGDDLLDLDADEELHLDLDLRLVADLLDPAERDEERSPSGADEEAPEAASTLPPSARRPRIEGPAH